MAMVCIAEAFQSLSDPGTSDLLQSEMASRSHKSIGTHNRCPALVLGSVVHVGLGNEGIVYRVSVTVCWQCEYLKPCPSPSL